VSYADAVTELIEILSPLVFDEPGQVGFFESERKQLMGKEWEVVVLPAMAYDPSEDLFLLEEDNLEYLFSRIRNHNRQRIIMLSMVAHELRHRVQCKIPETILWSEKDSLVKARKDLLAKIRRIKRFIRWYYPEKAYPIELDARIISTLVASEANETLEHIADLIRYGPLVFEKFPDWLYFL